MSPEQYTALKNLKKDESICILPADKGNATIVLDKTTYNNKAGEIINSDTYLRVSNDPTTKYQPESTHFVIPLDSVALLKYINLCALSVLLFQEYNLFVIPWLSN